MLQWTAASKESQNINHCSGFLVIVGNFSLGRGLEEDAAGVFSRFGKGWVLNCSTEGSVAVAMMNWNSKGFLTHAQGFRFWEILLLIVW